MRLLKPLLTLPSLNILGLKNRDADVFKSKVILLMLVTSNHLYDLYMTYEAQTVCPGHCIRPDPLENSRHMDVNGSGEFQTVFQSKPVGPQC